MQPDAVKPMPIEDLRPRRRLELLVFVVLAIIVWPIVAVGVVGGWGFVVWMSQQVYGPPGPPHR